MFKNFKEFEKKTILIESCDTDTIKVTDTVFEDLHYSIESTNFEGLYYVTCKPEFEFLGYYIMK